MPGNGKELKGSEGGGKSGGARGRRPGRGAVEKGAGTVQCSAHNSNRSKMAGCKGPVFLGIFTTIVTFQLTQICNNMLPLVMLRVVFMIRFSNFEIMFSFSWNSYGSLFPKFLAQLKPAIYTFHHFTFFRDPNSKSNTSAAETMWTGANNPSRLRMCIFILSLSRDNPVWKPKVSFCQPAVHGSWFCIIEFLGQTGRDLAGKIQALLDWRRLPWVSLTH